MASKVWRAGAPVALVAAGFLFAVSAQTSQGADLRPGRYDNVEDLVRAQSQQVSRLEAQVRELNADIEALQEQSQDPTIDAARERSAALQAPVGLTAVTGPGVAVALDDAPLPAGGAELPPGTTYDDFVVHQQDVEGVINALWAGGAEAVTVMDRRIITTSAVRCVGNVLILDGQVYSPPFVIAGIGNAQSMSQALDDSPQVANYRSWASVIGLGYDFKVLNEIAMPAYAGSPQLRHATVAEESQP